MLQKDLRIGVKCSNFFVGKNEVTLLPGAAAKGPRYAHGFNNVRHLILMVVRCTAGLLY